MDGHLQIVAILGTLALLLLVLELVRRRRLLERYALVWLGSALILLALGVWTGLLSRIAEAMGIATPSNALFAIAFGFVLLLLLHFSIAVSKLTEKTSPATPSAASTGRPRHGAGCCNRASTSRRPA